MSAHTTPALPLADALNASEPLVRLAERLRESRQRFAIIEAVLPPALAAHARPGPVDPHGWTLLAGNAAVAAKLRQLVPLFDEQLAAQGFPPVPIRVKVQHRP